MRYYNLFLDDFRQPVDAFNFTKDTSYVHLEWKIVKNYEQFVDYVERNYEHGYFPSLISFDHDLAPDHYEVDFQDWDIYSSDDLRVEETGYDCAKWLIDFCIDKKISLPGFMVHSMNPVGRKRIEGLLNNFEKQNK